MARSCFLSVTLAISLGLAFTTAEPADAPRIERLIAQLGSAKFSEREAASHALDAIGTPALDALKKAVKSDDAETRRRAEELVGKIERRLETERLLAPTKVHLVCKDTRIDDALAELRKQSGEALALPRGDVEKLAGLPVTFDSGTTTYWEALDQLCQVANLNETLELVPATNGDKRDTPVKPARLLRLSDRKVTALPTHYAGALRLRALNATRASANEVGLLLGAAVEAKTALERIHAVRIDKALDEHGQSLAQVAGTEPVENTGAATYLENPKGGALRLVATGERLVPVRLQEGAKPSARLKELTGVLTAQARTVPEALLTVDDILKAAPRPTDAKDGARLNVLEVEKDANGDVKLRLEIHPPPESHGDVVVPRRGRFRVRVLAGGVGPAILDFIGESQVLKLVDVKGESFPPPTMPAHLMRITNNVVSHELTLLYHPKDGQAEAAKLVYHGSRPVMIEVPFTLKDVPLP